MSHYLVRVIGGVFLLAAIGAVAFGGARAYAANTHTIVAGAESADMSVQIYDFIPNPVTINVGDTVSWRVDSSEFHTVTFMSGAPVPPFVAPGEAGLAINPLAVMPEGSSQYDGDGIRSSGLLNKGQTYSLTFAAPGTFEYVCLVHPHMVAEIVVVEASAAADTPAETEAKIAPHIASALASRGLPLTMENATERVSTNSSGEPVAGVSAGDGDQHVALYRFLPGNVTVHRGETVEWTNYDTDTPHTVTFVAGGSQPEMITPVMRPDGPPTLVINPMVWMPQGGNVVDGSAYVNSGFIGAEVPVTTFAARFTTPGTYEYICVLHDGMGMRGTVTVLP